MSLSENSHGSFFLCIECNRKFSEFLWEIIRIAFDPVILRHSKTFFYLFILNNNFSSAYTIFSITISKSFIKNGSTLNSIHVYAYRT